MCVFIVYVFRVFCLVCLFFVFLLFFIFLFVFVVCVLVLVCFCVLGAWWCVGGVLFCGFCFIFGGVVEGVCMLRGGHI